MLGIHVQKGPPKSWKPAAQPLQPSHKKRLQNRPAKKYNKNWKQLPQFPIMAILAVPPITQLPNHPITQSSHPLTQRPIMAILAILAILAIPPGLGPPSK